MARSKYIYTVRSYPARYLMGCFTVKREMIKALSLLTREFISVCRHPDGELYTSRLLAAGPVDEVIHNLQKGAKNG